MSRAMQFICVYIYLAYFVELIVIFIHRISQYWHSTQTSVIVLCLCCRLYEYVLNTVVLYIL